MILDKLVNMYLYINTNNRLKKALEYISETDFSEMDLGKHELNSPGMFVIVNEYKTKVSNTNILEAHKKYIDLQYILKGNEIIEYETLYNQEITQEYDNKNDYILYAAKNKSKLKFSEGMFAIFFPDDLHMPGLLYDKPENIIKIVVKVLF